MIQTIYSNNCRLCSDINEHLPTLYNLALSVQTITEMGTRNGSSTSAFLAAICDTEKTLTSVDLFKSDIIDTFLCQKNFKFIQADTLKIEIENTDLLFIDTLHTYFQLFNELTKHSKKVFKYIILHDTISFGYNDEQYYQSSDLVKMSDLVKETSKSGLNTAVTDFLETEDGKNWIIKAVYTNNNGLTVLERISAI